jgi:hypothetical protein
VKRSLLLLFVATGCSGFDGADPGGDVVGAWRELPPATLASAPPVDQRAVYTFAADGTWTRDDATSHHTGTYVVEDGELAFAGSATHSSLYFADGERLLLDVATPDDDGADVVATWTGHVVDTNGSVDDIATYAGDMTFHLDESRNGTEVPADGTWRQVDDAVEATFERNGLTDQRVVTIHRGLLGTAFERI